MPELPEVETVRRGLDREFNGKRVKTVEVTGERSVRRQPVEEFAAKLEGTKIKAVKRAGKYLTIELDSGDVWVIHLRMSGQLLKAQAKEELPKHTHVVISFTQGGQLRFVDPRTFGEMFVTTKDAVTDEIPELANLGMDVVDSPVSWVKFGEALMRRTTKLKTLLMDQTFLAGLGNIYSDEVLFEAGLRQDRTPQSLSTMEVRRLYRAIVEVLHEAVKHRGSTLSDQQYVDLYGRPGEYQELHQVYDREGQPCRRCRIPIARERVSNRSTFYCPNCQV